MPVVENESQREAVGAVMELVLDQAERVAERCRAMSEERARRTTCPCALFARATEWAALAAARWLGRDDQDAAEEAAEGAMLAGLSELPISATIVIGADEGGVLAVGADVGAGGEAFDLALDPLEGRGVVARGGTGAMSMLAVGPPGSLLRLPDMYMRRMAVGPRAQGRIDLTRPVGENVAAIADAFGRNANDITTIVLDRPRHHDLIEEIRAAGARIKLIQDGDVTASISAAIRGTNDHLAIGIGGTRQAVLSAAALRCLGGELQAQLWPTTRSRDRGGGRARGRGRQSRLLLRRPRAGGGDRRRDGRLERRPPARRPLPRRQRPHPLARHVHALQLGALRRRASTSSPASGKRRCACSARVPPR